MDHTPSAIRLGFAAEIIVMGKACHVSHYFEGCSIRQLSSSSLLAGKSTNIWNWSSVAEAIYLTSNLKMRNFKSGSCKPLLSAFGSAVVWLWVKLKVGSYHPEKLGAWHINFRNTICVFLRFFLSTILNLCFWSKPDQETIYCWIGRWQIEMLLQSTTQRKRSNLDSYKVAGIHWSEELKLVWLFVEIIDQPKLWGICLVKSLDFTIIIMKAYYYIVYYVSPIFNCWSFLQIVHKGNSMKTSMTT